MCINHCQSVSMKRIYSSFLWFPNADMNKQLKNVFIEDTNETLLPKRQWYVFPLHSLLWMQGSKASLDMAFTLLSHNILVAPPEGLLIGGFLCEAVFPKTDGSFGGFRVIRPDHAYPELCGQMYVTDKNIYFQPRVLIQKYFVFLMYRLNNITNFLFCINLNILFLKIPEKIWLNRICIQCTMPAIVDCRSTQKEVKSI